MYVCIFFFCVAPEIGLQLQCQRLAKSVRPKNESGIFNFDTEKQKEKQSEKIKSKEETRNEIK